MPHLLSAEVLRFGHPSGIMTVYPRVSIANGIRHVESISMGSCARRIMDGALYVRR
jgi:2-methylaconitate cis-trans-isomerase PrpF